MIKNARISKILVFVGLCLGLIFFPSNNSNSASVNSAAFEVKKYCELDFNGARISGGDYKEIRNLMAWDEDRDEPGWDCFIIISDYKITNEAVKQDAAYVTVKYNVIARFCSDYSLEKKGYIDTVDFKLTRADSFWKIKDYVLYPRISKKTAINYLRKRSKLLKEDKVELNKINSLIDNLKKLEK